MRAALLFFLSACAPVVELELRSSSDGFPTLSAVEFFAQGLGRCDSLSFSGRQDISEALPILAPLRLPEEARDCSFSLDVRLFVGALEVGRSSLLLSPEQERASLFFSVCSNGAGEGVEACDDGNLSDGDGCDSTCKPTGCASGVSTPGELCFVSNDDLRGPLGPSQVIAADLDGDAQPDLVAPYPLDGVVRLYPGDGRGVFGAFVEVPVPGVRRLALGDLDQDGTQDLVALSGQTATVLLADGAGGFLARPGPSALGADIVAAELADLNGDGALDLVTLDKAQGALSWRPGNNDGSFGGIDPAGQILPLGASPVALALGDIDTDGDLDAVVVLSSGFGQVLLNGAGGLALDSGIIGLGGVPSALELADLNGDGRLDLAVSKQHEGSGFARIFKGESLGRFSFVADFDAPNEPSALLARDFDMDGDVDLAATGESGAVIAVQFNNGAGQFDAPRDASGGVFETREAPISLAAEDLNSDGVPDLVAAGVNLGLLLSTP